MCVCTKPGITAQSVASMIGSAACPVPPTSAIRPSTTKTSPRTTESRASIVTRVPFLMRIDDIKVPATKRHTKHKYLSLNTYALCASLCGLSLLLVGGSGGFAHLQFFANRQPQLHFHVSLDFAEHL